MYLVGLTGGIASGKSTVAARLVEHGAELIDADAIAREVVLPGTSTWNKIVQHFGAGVLDAEGFVDRPALGAIVFAAPDKRRLLNELTHPPVIAEIADRLEVLQAFDGVVVLDVPLLVEAGVHRGYQAVVVVASQPETQVRRLTELRGMAESEARARVAAQAPLEDKLTVATHVIRNEGTLEELLATTDAVAEELQCLADRQHAAEGDAVPND
ncbi:MAG: dephospho-CoA kinase [Euzebyales bacterium]|nr:dephospho-CoA kinase [Euzebyales bacterium]